MIVLGVFAQRLDAGGFGAVSIALTITSLSFGVSRSLGTDSLLVRHSDPTQPGWAMAVNSAASTTAAAGVLISVLVLAGILVSASELHGMFIVLGIALPVVCLQDGWRFTFFAAGRPELAFFNDAVWVGLFVLIAFSPIGSAVSEAWSATLVWAVGGISAAVFGYLQIQRVFGQLTPRQRMVEPRAPSEVHLRHGSESLASAAVGNGSARQPTRVSIRLHLVSDWLRTNRAMAVRFLVESIMLSGAAQLLLLLVGARQGLDAAGAMRAAALILGPASVVIYGILAATVPEGSRLAKTPQAVVRLTVGLATIASIVMLAWALASRHLPPELGSELLSDRWDAAMPLVVPLAFYYAGLAVATVSGAGLRSLGATRESMQVITATGVLLLAAGLVGSAVDVLMVCRAIAVMAWVGATICTWRFVTVANRSTASMTEPV